MNMLNDFILAGQKDIQVVIFSLNEEEYAVPISFVQEIINPLVFTKIPKSPFFVEGVINLRGHIIPVISGEKRFNLEFKDNYDSNSTKIIVVKLEDDTIGLIVDNVSEVVHINVDDIEPPPVDPNDSTEIIWGVGKYQKRLIILLDPRKFMNFEETEDLMDFNQVSDMIKKTKKLSKAEKKPKAVKIET